MALSDHQLLQKHLHKPSGPALAELVDRHLPLIHSVARRITTNDEAARDISQIVFLRLVKKASKLPKSLPLTAWCHRETHSASVDYVRSEVRRQKREKTAADLDAMKTSSESWDQLTPEIDGAIDELCESDRALVLLRFYNNKTFPEIARTLGINHDTARMRTNRALEKLRVILAKRGITTTTALLASTLPTTAVSPAPASLANSITSSIQSTGATAGALSFVKSHLLALGSLSIGVAAVTTQQIRINQLKETESATASPAPQSQRSIRSFAISKIPKTASFSEPDLLAIFANPDPAERLRLLHDYSLQLSTNHISEALELLRSKTPEWDSESKILTHLLLTRWAKADPEAAFSSLDTANFSLERGHSLSILSALAALDPKRAANWLTSPANTRAYYPIVGHVLSGTIAKEWARQDPRAALEWAQTLADQQQAGAYSGVLGTIAATDPQKAATLALGLKAGDARNDILAEIAQSWARYSPVKALAWTLTLPPEARGHATSRALESWSKTHPEKAAQYLDENPNPEHLKLIANQWSKRDPEGTANWIASKTESPQRNSALADTLWHWTTQTPKAATAWIEGLPAGNSRDQAIAGLAVAAVEFDPRSALEWALKISAPSLRNDLSRHTFKAWSRSSPKIAQQWANDHQFSPDN
ncbi:MAG: sigma-70 family RNA polymerase sigma factor [Akkermansiaceae bacterium]|nr:sigma-70 family RNA polymerase sigma factor [Akkermansiaceae bacterium]